MKKHLSKIQNIKGMSDMFESCQHYNHILSRSAQQVLEPKFGYKPLMLNTLEKAEVFSRTLGVSSDIVQKEMYSFTDLSNNQVVLRPEGTAGCMRWLMGRNDLTTLIEKEPVKLWYHGPMFRYERPQAGRMR